MPTPRETAELTGLRVADEYRRSRALPGEFRDWLRREHGVNTDVLTTEQVDRFSREWAQVFLDEMDRKAA